MAGLAGGYSTAWQQQGASLWSTQIVPGGGPVQGSLAGYYQYQGGGGVAPVAPAAPPVAAPQAVTEAAAAAAGGAISNTKMPVSWGDRRVYGKVIDHIIHAIDPDTGFGSETLCVSAGEPLFKDIPNNLYKITAGATVIYDETQGGIVHPALSDVRWYDGTDDAQIQDPAFVEVYGADVVPGYIGQMIAVLEFSTYEPWQGSRPEPFTIFIQDAIPGGGYQPWGGVWDIDASATNIDLSNSDKTATINNPGGLDVGMLRGTIGHTSGLRYFELSVDNWVGATVGGLAVAYWRWGFIGEDADWDEQILGGGAPDAYKSVSVDSLSSLKSFNAGLLSFAHLSAAASEGSRVGVAVDFDTHARPVYWVTTDGVTWFGNGFYGGTSDLPIDSTDGMTNLSPVTEETFYPAWTGAEDGDAVTLYTALDDFTLGPPGAIGEVVPGVLRNWGEVFVELANHANLDPNHIVTQDITEASEGGIIYDGFSWTDVVTNAGKISNIDWWEDGEDIFIRQTAFDNPANDVASVSSSHRYIIDEDKGATDADRGGERRKPVVYSLGFYDVSRQFQESFMMARSEVHLSVREEKLSTPFVMTATEAATRAAIALGKSEMEFEEHHHELPPIVPYVRLRPADIVTFLEEGKTMQTKVSRWELETDWTIKTSYRKLFTTATEPTVPFTGETISANMPEYPQSEYALWFTEPDNSGRWTLFEDI